MKLRDSGMPEEVYWESLFEVPRILSRLGLDSTVSDVAELGCGYGTFTIPIAQAIRGSIYTFDVEQVLVDRTCQRAQQVGLHNVVCRLGDVMESGFDVPAPVDAVLLFNILHCHDPGRLIGHAFTCVRPGGRMLAIHWRYDCATPRGPSLDIRPRPEQIVEWAVQAGLAWAGAVVDLPPWHYGLSFTRGDK